MDFVRKLVVVSVSLGLGCTSIPETAEVAEVSEDGAGATEVADSCGIGTMMFVETGKCLPVVDLLIPLPDGPIPGPGLDVLRGGQSPATEPVLNSNFAAACTSGNAIAAGVTYKTGSLVVAGATAALQTDVKIHVGGVADPTGDPPCVLFETATNRTEKGVEVVIVYLNGSAPSIQFFDWSCSSGYPCGSLTGPSYVFLEQLSNLSSCYKDAYVDAGGHSRYRIIYNNETIKGKVVPLVDQAWTNRISIFNNCLLRWDVFYSHTYRSNQLDCSTGNACGWWGPILETNNPSPQPSIKESGFGGTSVLDHGTWYGLTTANTNWVAPASPWTQYHRTANSEWGVGSSTAE